MRIAVFGAGAIGGHLAAKLAAAGRVELSLVARGEHLAALRERGLRLIEGDTDNTYPVKASDDAAELGVQDYVVLTMKAHSVPPALPAIAPLIGPETAVVTMQNGVPWWYFYRSGGPHEGSANRSRRPRRGDLGSARAGAGDRHGGLCRGRGRGAGRRPPCLRRTHLARRAVGREERARGAPRRGDDRRRHCRRRSAPTSGARSGSSCGATCRSTRSRR